MFDRNKPCGDCLCSAIPYEATGTARPRAVCHCHMGQRATGGPPIALRGEGSMSPKEYDASAGTYDQVFGRVSREFVPILLRVARLAPGMRVLDIATGTGLVAEAALSAVGPSGHVVAADTRRLCWNGRGSAWAGSRTRPSPSRTGRH